MNSFAIKRTGSWLAALVLAFAFACSTFCGQAFADEQKQEGSQVTDAAIAMCVYLDEEAPEAGAFQFEMKAVTEGAPAPVATIVSNDADGNFEFNVNGFAEPGTYEYVISQVPGSDESIYYDQHDELIVVTVEQVDDALVADIEYIDTMYGFYNETITESAPTLLLNVGSYVELDGRGIVEGEFAFCIDPVSEGAPAFSNSPAYCDADGNFDFGEVEFDQVGTYEYVMYQVAGNDPDVIYDLNEFAVTVTTFIDEDGMMDCEVTCNGSEDMAPFYNTYTGGDDEQAAPEGKDGDSSTQVEAEDKTTQSKFPETSDGSGALAGFLAGTAAAAAAIFGITRKRLSA